MKGKLILGNDQVYSLDCFETKLNNNVLVVGGSGSGKTTGVVIPNIEEAFGSYIITDPKGNLYRKLGSSLKEKGYRVLNLDLSMPNGHTGYNFFDYIETEQDVIKVAHILMCGAGHGGFDGHNAYFYQTGELMLGSAIASVKWLESYKPDLKCLDPLLNYCQRSLMGGPNKNYDPSAPDDYEEWASLSDRLAVNLHDLASDTASSISSTIASVLGKLNTKGVEDMMLSNKNKIDIKDIGRRKTALFVTVSDTDRSMDVLVNIFSTQAMNVLCRYADTECKNESLPVPVRFIMDDFATNCTIEDFPRMISSIRSRNISAMIMIQAESQLEDRFGKEAFTIISNCDSYLYMGGNDLETAKRVAERADIPFKKVLYMPVGTNWLFRRGQEPINGKNILPETNHIRIRS